MTEAAIADFRRLIWAVAHDIAQDKVEYLTERAKRSSDPGDALADYLKAGFLTWLDLSIFAPNSQKYPPRFNW